MKLNVLHLTSSTNASGGSRQAFLLARGQRAAGQGVLFCAPRGAQTLGWARGAGLATEEIPTGGLGVQWSSSRRLRAVVRQRGIDIVHTHHTVGHNIGLFATFGGEFPPLVVNRGVLFEPKLRLKFRSNRNAALITNSRAVSEVLERCGVEREKIHVIYNAVSMPDVESIVRDKGRLKEELKLRDSSPVVGTVGSGRPEKGFQFLVEAAPSILRTHPKAIFVLVGADTSRFLPRLRQLGIGNSFRLLGARTDVSSILALMDVFVIPSIGMDSCPNVLLEAMSAGLPAVGSRVGGIPELLVDGGTGAIVPPGDPSPLAAAIQGLLEAPDRAAEMGAEGRHMVETRFSVEAKVRKTLGVYRGLTRERRS